MKKLMTSMMFLALVLGFSTGHANATVAQGEIPYYGETFFKELKTGLSGRELVMKLNSILKSTHTANENGYDTIAEECQGEICYSHKSLGYNRARQHMMGDFYLLKKETPEGVEYGLKDVYCSRIVTKQDFPKGDEPRPNEIPDGNIVNTEHTWPQSRFSKQYNTEMQKSDLHHLYPTDNKMNAIRGNYTFGEVEQDHRTLNCPEVRFGTSDKGVQKTFEPPEKHKGNVARALFYFSTRYELPIDPEEEATLRQWNIQDPVDQEERTLNEKIFQVQQNRNPFIDYPTLVDRVQDF